MKKIQIIGYSGSGKTTLAKTLSQKLKIPHHQLDEIYILPNWEVKNEEDFRKDVMLILESDSWILCGDYLNMLSGLTANKADTVIWLNYPPRIFFYRMTKRTIKRSITKEEILNGNTESFINFLFRPSKSLIYANIKKYLRQGRSRQKEKLEKYNYKGELVEFKHPRELEKWLKTL